MIEIPRVETQRLVLRPLGLDDARDVQVLAGDFAIADTTARIPHPYEDGMAEAWIASLAEAIQPRQEWVFGIEESASGCLMGTVGLVSPGEDGDAELGYWIGRPYWNQGFATEAARVVVDFGFEHAGIARVHAHHFSRNPASGRVLQKLGFRHGGMRRNFEIAPGRIEDVELYALAKKEWQTLPRPVTPAGS